ncbi:hypothetical protein ACKI1I_27785 [Streptomyces turgidiscabies]|uniref:Uncharacterized protein n=1 Tax=Streptomyces turgidiscabies (strain Car8) TaxID=698760 RepID=L7F101_STRT8|nr:MULTISPECIES: hypothetical protein [Streptomyces]ELP65348.1 hypothetical protein STRTUCAR8_07205 [Streptomyces turgidiscabies Car8]MDX3495311.1 hypothetical protein [Streptomyces turgidiscabies]GAQ69997.1 hypothetical protein T45_01729 [Streptomyces turgidiscabies]
MHWHRYLSGAFMLMAGALVVCGAVGVRTGRVLPWQRRRVLRPVLWGYGAMLLGAGLLVQTGYEEWTGTVHLRHLDGAVTVTGLLLMVAGFWFQLLSEREQVDA